MIKIVRSSSTNAEVTDYYLDVIASLMEACGEKKYEDDIDLKQCKKKDIIIAPTSVDFVKLYFEGYKNQIYCLTLFHFHIIQRKYRMELYCLFYYVLSKYLANPL